MRLLRVIVVIVAGLAVACAGDDGAAPTTTTSSPSTTAPPTTATVTTTTSPATSTVVTTTAPPTSSTADTESTLTVQVFFLDENAFNVGRLPYVRPVERTVPAETPEAASLDALFEGPTADERAGGLRFVASEATGIAALDITAGTAHVRLAGGCSSGGSTFTVADQIVATLVQFTSVDAVKIYDPDGQTGSPDEPGDSIPFCLEP